MPYGAPVPPHTPGPRVRTVFRLRDRSGDSLNIIIPADRGKDEPVEGGEIVGHHFKGKDTCRVVVEYWNDADNQLRCVCGEIQVVVVPATVNTIGRLRGFLANPP